MKAHVFAIFMLCVLGGCAKEPNVPSNWATTVRPAQDPVEPSCTQEHRLQEPRSGEPESLVRFGSETIDAYARLREDYDKCRTWAKGQRK